MPQPATIHDSPDLQRQALLDLAQRARGGVSIHLALWLLLGWFNGLVQTVPVFFWTTAALFATVLCLRLTCERRLAQRAVESRVSRAGFMLLLLWSPLQWGLLGACAWWWPTLEPARMLILTVIAGVAAAGGMGLAIDTTVRVAYPLLAMGPGAVALGLSPGNVNHSLALAALMFSVYVARASKVVHADYWAAARAREQLEERGRQLEKLSVTDALTQVHNRQFLDRQLGIEWARGQRDTHSLSLLMIDIDHFKRVNDSHGHPFGDVCLQEVARVLKSALHRPGDLVARYGGEEFAVLLPGIDIKGAQNVAARLHAAVSDLAMEKDGVRVPLSCSIGLHSVLDVVNCSAADALSIADQALYAAKRQGRNRIVVSAPSSAPLDAVEA